MGGAIYGAAICTVHPHGRGEHGACQGLQVNIFGSSPRAWGTSPRAHARGYFRRFIPTGVGNIATTSWSLPTISVHPHGRGEHLDEIASCYCPRGSSPRAWGTCGDVGAADRQNRFIPTGVGNMTFIAAASAESLGSSPRAWGTYGFIESQQIGRRFIPTGVGNMSRA